MIMMWKKHEKSFSTRDSIFIVLLFVINACCVEANTVAGTETLIGIVGKDFVMLGADSSVSSSGIALTASNLDKIATVVNPLPGKEKLSPVGSQQVICAAAAGDSADCDRLLGLIQAEVAMKEFDVGVGCDVDFIDCSGEAIGIGGSELIQIPLGLDVDSLSQLARTLIVEGLRRAPLKVCLLVAGMAVAQKGITEKAGHIAHRVQGQVMTASLPFLTPVEKTDDSSDNSESQGLTAEGQLVPRLYWLDEYGACQKVEYAAHGYGSMLVLSILDQGYQNGMSREEAASLMQRCFGQLRARFAVNSPEPPCIKCIDHSGCTVL